MPSELPSSGPCDTPNESLSLDPSISPSTIPSSAPTTILFRFPSTKPSLVPSSLPSEVPISGHRYVSLLESSGFPYMVSTTGPSMVPSNIPSIPSSGPCDSSSERLLSDSSISSTIPRSAPGSIPSRFYQVHHH